MQTFAAQAGRRQGRWWVLAVLALALVGLIAGIAQLSTREPDTGKVSVTGIDDAQRIFGGVRQLGDRLGSSDAAVAIQVFDDLQCSDCRSQFLATVPPLVEDEVRSGEVRLEYRHYSFSPNPAQVGFFAAEAAAEQGYAWQYVYLFFRNQREASRFGVDEDFLTALAGAIPELDVPEWRDYLERESGADGRISEQLAEYEELARGLGIRARPAAVVSGPGGTRTLQDGPGLSRITAAIEAVR
jgi:protein-disulfide isomerase